MFFGQYEEVRGTREGEWRIGGEGMEGWKMPMGIGEMDRGMEEGRCRKGILEGDAGRELIEEWKGMQGENG